MNSLSTLVFVVLYIISSVKSDSISIEGTGLNADGSLATQGGFEANWVLVQNGNDNVNDFVASNIASLDYAADTSSSQWIGPAADLHQSFPDDTYGYSTTFDLGGLDATTAQLSGSFAGDDTVEIFLNGHFVVGCYSDCWVSFTSFSVSTGFVSGLNTLQAVVVNEGGATGLQLSVSGTADSSTPTDFCAAVNQADWTYGQGYYCYQAGFLQCWGSPPASPIQYAYQDCPAGTSCGCPDGVECSDEGTVSPCS